MAERLLYSQLTQLSLDEVDELLGDLEAMSAAAVRQELTRPGNDPR